MAKENEVPHNKIADNLRRPDGDFGIKIGDFMHKGNSNFYVQLKNLVEWEKEMNVLEVGMGSGKHIGDLFTLFPQGVYYGIDYSATMVNESNKNNKNLVEQKKAAFHLEEASNFELNLKFDLIFTINTVYFFEDLIPVFNNYKRHLNKGGKLIIGKRPKSDLELLNNITQYGFVKYTNSQVLEKLIQSGFSILTQHSFKDKEGELEGFKIQLHSDFIIATL